MALVERTVQKMTDRLTDVADASKNEADMTVRMDKTYSQHVKFQDDITVTKKEIEKAHGKLEHKCDYCERRFKTARAMKIHRASCKFGYGTTE